MPKVIAGIALKLGATLAFSLMYVTILLAGTVPTGEVVFFRAFFAPSCRFSCWPYSP